MHYISSTVSNSYRFCKLFSTLRLKSISYKIRPQDIPWSRNFKKEYEICQYNNVQIKYHHVKQKISWILSERKIKWKIKESRIRERYIWPSVWPGVGSTFRWCLPNRIWSYGSRSISASAPLLCDIMDLQPGSSDFNRPVPVMWSACMCVFTATEEKDCAAERRC